MDSEIIVALITLLGSCLGTISGILVSSKPINYRLSRLEERVNKHNNIVERTYILEEKISVANHRIADLEEEIKNEKR